jgi:hypothetical protein
MFQRYAFVVITDPPLGLFAPRAGQHYRDEQRRRRSRYDRGTRLAALEECDYEEYYSAEQGFQGPYTGRISFSLYLSYPANEMERLIRLTIRSPLRPFSHTPGYFNLIEPLFRSELSNLAEIFVGFMDICYWCHDEQHNAGSS